MTNTDLYANTTAPVLEHIDPRLLTIGQNIRSVESLDLNPEFLDSIETLGVLEPIIGWYDHDSNVIVKAGQRRVLAAVKVSLKTVPVYIHATEPDTYGRITDQWAENHQREAMTLTDEVEAVNELALFGVPAGKIAATFGWDPEHVDDAIKITKSPKAKEAAVDFGLTLEYAALVADFDEPDEVELIVSAAEDDYPIEHITERLTSAREERAVTAKAVAEVEATGVKVVPLNYPMPSGQIRITMLRAKAGGDILTEEEHADCPQRGAAVTVRQSWRAQQDPDLEKWEVTVVPLCLDWREAGHVEAYPGNPAATPAAKVPAAELPDEEREAAKAERKRVVESNKAWKEATDVRAKWLLGFGKHKEPMAGAEKFVGAHLVTWIPTAATHLPLVGLDRDKVTTELNRASAKRASHLVTCVVVASIEDHLTADAWRSQLPIAGPYLETLSKWGYGLSDIETRIIADAKAAAKTKGGRK